MRAPLPLAAVHSIWTESFALSSTRILGILGAPTVTRTASLMGLSPTAFTAVNRMETVSPMVAPYTVATCPVN